jgi:hypothetical protein
MTSDSGGEHPADIASGPSGCPRYRENSTTKYKVCVEHMCHTEGGIKEAISLLIYVVVPVGGNQVHKFANRSPISRSSHRVEGATTCGCRRDVLICSC